MILVKLYVIVNIIMFLPDEEWNAQNPRPFPKKDYVIMNWEPEDFAHWQISNEYVLLEYRKEDNKYKAKARRYWHEQKAKRIR
jgi:hypothetical protein